MRIVEILIVEVDGVEYEVQNDGIKKFKNQNPQALPDMEDFITEQVRKGETTGWLPYANFESSIEWKPKGVGEWKHPVKK